MAMASGKPTLSVLANRVRRATRTATASRTSPYGGLPTALHPEVGSNYTTSGVFQAVGETGDIPGTGDFDGDGKTDFGIYRPSTGTWYALLSIFDLMPSDEVPPFQFGLSGDIPVVGNYNGFGFTNVAVYRPSTGVWYILEDIDSKKFRSYQWGLPVTPLPGDYDGDGVTDLAVYRPSTGVWHILQSSTHFTTFVSFQWGLGGDIPVPGDYDGDGKTDLAVYRPSNGLWFIKQSSTGYATFVVLQFGGAPGDTPVPGDFDGDGKTDVAFFRAGAWFFLKSSTNFTTSGALLWGQSGDIPILRRP
jgi:hypothetical protein